MQYTSNEDLLPFDYGAMLLILIHLLKVRVAEVKRSRETRGKNWTLTKNLS